MAGECTVMRQHEDAVGELQLLPLAHRRNIVATVNLCCQLDLRQIALRARNVEYNPRRFAAVIMRSREHRTTALLFQSGKIVYTGVRSELQARIAARKFARITQKFGYNARFADFKVQNIVASCDVGFCIKLESLALNHSQFSRVISDGIFMR
ncbi:uncharacterized protein LOC144117451 [Amblyomma americanum]